MSENFFNENDTPWEICEKIILSTIDDGFQNTQRKILDEIKSAYNNPLKLDAKKMMEDAIDEINEREKKERKKLTGEGHEYFFYGNINNGVRKMIDVTEKNKEKIQEIWDTVKQGASWDDITKVGD